MKAEKNQSREFCWHFRLDKGNTVHAQECYLFLGYGRRGRLRLGLARDGAKFGALWEVGLGLVPLRFDFGGRILLVVA